jgi:hypothetical protein
MARAVNIVLVLLLGAAGAAACSDRKAPQEDAEARAACDLRCERLDTCGLDIGADSEAECSDICLNGDDEAWQWKDCRAETLPLYECINALSCDDLTDVEDPNDGIDSTTEPCWNIRLDYGHCYAEVMPHGG